MSNEYVEYVISVLKEKQQELKDELKYTKHNSHAIETMKLRITQLQKAIDILNQDSKDKVIASGMVKCIEENEKGEAITFCLDTTFTTDEGDLLFDWVFKKYDGQDIEIRLKNNDN